MRVISVARKPLSESTVASNVLRHGTGALNIGATRIAHASPDDFAKHEAMVVAIKARGGHMGNSWKNSSDLSQANDAPKAGRWPANLILVHRDGCRETGSRKVKGVGPGSGGGFKDGKFSGQVGEGSYTGSTFGGFADKDGTETVASWDCEPDCPVLDLNRQSGVSTAGAGGNKATSGFVNGYQSGDYTIPPKGGDTGGASRYFKMVGGKKP